MATVISIANQKGGVAKTTTTRHIAYLLEQHGQDVLVVDNDHQASATVYFNVDPVEQDRTTGTMAQVYGEGRPIENVLVKVGDRTWLAPSALSLAEVGTQLLTAIDNNTRLRSSLQPVLDRFDYVLIDCGPNLDRLLVNALTASHYVLVPVKTDKLSVYGIPALFNTIRQVRLSLNPGLRVLGVLPTLYHRGRVQDDKWLSELREQCSHSGVPLLEPIPATTNFDKAVDEGRTAFEVNPHTVGLSQYEALAAVILSL